MMYRHIKSSHVEKSNTVSNGNIVNECRVPLLLLESIVCIMLKGTASMHCLLLLLKRVNAIIDLAPKRHPC
jgi:hypothetical protein